MNPSNWAQKNPALADAAKAYPKRVFQAWLRLRRQGADQFFPGWRTIESRPRRVQVLDLGAVLKARFN
jgi:hypothetical protein